MKNRLNMPPKPKQDGFTKVPNKLLEAKAKLRVSGDVGSILDVVLRLTYGYGQKIAPIPVSVFVKMTGMHKQNVARAVKKALKMNLLIRYESSKVMDSNKWLINTDFETWREYSNPSPSVKGDSNLITNPPSDSTEYIYKYKDNSRSAETASKPVLEKLQVPFDQATALAKLADPAQTKSLIHRIAGYLMAEHGLAYENKAQFNAAFGRALRSAKLLEGYNKLQVGKAIEFTRKQAAELNFGWTYETVVKNIANAVNQPVAPKTLVTLDTSSPGYDPALDPRLEASRRLAIAHMTPEQKKLFGIEDA